MGNKPRISVEDVRLCVRVAGGVCVCRGRVCVHCTESKSELVAMPKSDVRSGHEEDQIMGGCGTNGEQRGRCNGQRPNHAEE